MEVFVVGRQFYTQVLGFQVKTSAPYGPEERWLTVVAPGDPDGVELALHLADEPVRAFQAASRQAGRPVLLLRSDDCQGEAERLKAKGVVFVEEPYRRTTAASTRFHRHLRQPAQPATGLTIEPPVDPTRRGRHRNPRGRRGLPGSRPGLSTGSSWRRVQRQATATSAVDPAGSHSYRQ
jgi:catechol 2,3-dioxygenase-like lactoylglutathione lyase family enzyme